MINLGDTVRVISEGIFKGQEVRVLRIDVKFIRHVERVWYLLDTTANLNKTGSTMSYPSWFEIHEIEPVEVVA